MRNKQRLQLRTTLPVFQWIQLLVNQSEQRSSSFNSTVKLNNIS